MNQQNHKTKMQMSETFLLNGILAFSGGFQDAYTYNVRDEVFSNAQTGNVVLMSQHFLMGEWTTGLRYLFPILAFAFGVLIAEQIGHHYKYAKKLHWRQIILLFELILLFAVGFIPGRYNLLATMLVSFTCAMQVQTFRKVRGHAYASTMCIGNLRSGTEALCEYFHDKNPAVLRRALTYFGVIGIFALGAGAGAWITARAGERTIWISCALLTVSFLLMFLREKRAEEKELL